MPSPNAVNPAGSVAVPDQATQAAVTAESRQLPPWSETPHDLQQAEPAAAGQAGPADAPPLAPPALPPSFSVIPDVGSQPPSQERSFGRRSVVVVLVALLAVAAAAATFLLSRPDHDADYVKALRIKGLLGDYASEPAAVAHGKGFCRKLEQGAEPQGFASEKVAVAVYCGSFLGGFTVVPTPAEQEETYLTSLKVGGFAGQFASDAAAVAQGKVFCTRLNAGAAPQGKPVDALALPVYCPKFVDGFKVLQTATVEGTFELIDSSLYASGIVSYGGRCTGTGGYSDIGPGTDVVVKDGSGKTLAHTTLSHGSGSEVDCTFDFTFDIDEGADDYLVTVADRGEVHESFTEMQNDGLQITLGN